MERIDQIIKHAVYQKSLRKIGELEEKRIFCGHDFTHFLDVARIAYIMSLEEEAAIPKELIYAAALLHDIGRHEQYLHGTPHHEASAAIAGPILEACGFSKEEKQIILDAILEHRTAKEKGGRLSAILCRADKISRPCYKCEAERECNWSLEKKNRHLQY